MKIFCSTKRVTLEFVTPKEPSLTLPFLTTSRQSSIGLSIGGKTPAPLRAPECPFVTLVRHGQLDSSGANKKDEQMMVNKQHFLPAALNEKDLRDAFLSRLVYKVTLRLSFLFLFPCQSFLVISLSVSILSVLVSYHLFQCLSFLLILFQCLSFLFISLSLSLSSPLQEELKRWVVSGEDYVGVLGSVIDDVNPFCRFTIPQTECFVRNQHQKVFFVFTHLSIYLFVCCGICPSQYMLVHYDFSQMQPFESKFLRLCISWRDHLYCI